MTIVGMRKHDVPFAKHTLSEPIHVQNNPTDKGLDHANSPIPAPRILQINL